MFKKLIASFILSTFFLLTLVVPFAQAQVIQGGTWYHPSWGEFNEKVYDQNNQDEIFGERYTQAQVVWIFHALKNTLIPFRMLQCWSIILVNPHATATCIGSWTADIFNAVTLNSVPEDSNLAQVIDNLTTNNPISGVGYVRNLVTKFHLIPEAQAQGFGFGTLSPVQQIWKAIRNIAYFLLVIAFIVIAFMVMFRMRISPQTVITVQSAIPRAIFTLLLITFSYAIAGFVIDVSYVIVGLLAVAGDSVSTLSSIELFGTLISHRPFMAMLLTPLQYILAIFQTGGAFTAPQFAFMILMVFLQVVLAIIVLVTLLLVWLKMWWVLLKAFVNIMLLTVFGPIIILGGIFPNIGGFGSWLRDLLAQVAIFPGVIAILFLAQFFFWSSIDANATAATNPVDFVFLTLNTSATLNPYGIVPLQTGTFDIKLPGFSFGFGSIEGFMLALGIMFLVPNVANIIQSVISRRPFGYGTAIGEAFGPAGVIGLGGVSYLSASQQAAAASLARAGKTPSTLRQGYDTFWGVVRGTSGGRIK